jgi:hypothetical protein
VAEAEVAREEAAEATEEASEVETEDLSGAVHPEHILSGTNEPPCRNFIVFSNQ